MYESLEEVGTKYGVERATAMGVDLVAATKRVQDVQHANIEADDLRHIITEAGGG